MHALKAFSVTLALTGAFSLAPFGSIAHAQQFQYCKADVQRLCKGVEPGKGRLLQCLKSHENSLSVGCAKELKAMKSKMGK